MFDISVVLPVYNVEKYIGECLDSLVNQTLDLESFEIIAINDGSTDNSLKILEKYKTKLPNLRIYSQENKGLSEARNKGINVSKGEYIYFLDSDDCISKNALELIKKHTINSELDLLFFGGKSFYDGDNNKAIKTDEFKKKGKYDAIMTGEDAFIKLLESRDYTSSVCLYVIRREFVVNNSLFFVPGILHEDELFTYLALLKSNYVYVINDELFLRRIRNNSIMTSENYEKSFNGIYYTLVEMLKYRNSLQLNEHMKLKQFIDLKISYIYGGSLNKYIKIKNKDQFTNDILDIKTIGRENNYFNRFEYRLFDKSENLYSIFRSTYDRIKK
ncbi:glycosyltransferase [Aerococcus urinaeequi]|uniref:glycosyltransferase n=1 Tax=Aerococcus urinaeequi TaxID=51665 RepID=UPI003AABE851